MITKEEIKELRKLYDKTTKGLYRVDEGAGGYVCVKQENFYGTRRICGFVQHEHNWKNDYYFYLQVMNRMEDILKIIENKSKEQVAFVEEQMEGII